MVLSLTVRLLSPEEMEVLLRSFARAGNLLRPLAVGTAPAAGGG
jgi:hypothetical protein